MAKYPDLYEASIAELQDGLGKGLFTSVDLVKAYFARTEEVNLKGPALHAVIETNPIALEQAAALDDERKIYGARGPLHGIPILLKDNIATLHSEGMNTTAGSHALLGSVVPRDATVAAKLRDAGAILLGKASLSEWANWRGKVPSGFSGRGGQCVSPYVPLGHPSGSSSGSGVATAVGLAAGSLGSETDGSIISPSSHCNIVGIKPTVGLTSRAGVIPISEHQDSIGPMCRSVADVAVLLNTIVGRDPLDSYSLAQPETPPDYMQALKVDGLKGARLGVPRKLFGGVDVNIMAAFNATLDVFRKLGATVVDPVEFPDYDYDAISPRETLVMCADFKVNVKEYISGLLDVPTGVKDLSDLIAFNKEHADIELIEPYWNDQSMFIQSNETPRDQTYDDALAANTAMGRSGGIDGALKQYNLDAIVVPTGGCASKPAAIAAYPVLTVPLGFQPPDVVLSDAEPTRTMGPHMPFGISFLGTAYSEFNLIKYAYAYEQATKTRLKRLAYADAIPKTQLADVIGK